MVRIKNTLEPPLSSAYIVTITWKRDCVLLHCVYLSVSVQQPKTKPIINHSVYCEVPGVQIGEVKSSSDYPVYNKHKRITFTEQSIM